ncbi:hypothetical protein JTB14_024847 [Gonioctena quinquepunctata]|nr:hypothetical protein JTB14_024847 [Gonioctena quinquepunctata]
MASTRKRSRIPVEVSDNDYDPEEDASEPSDYEEHSDTDDEDTEEARSEIGEDSDTERNLKDKIMRMYDRSGGGSQLMNSLEYCLSYSIVDTNPQSTDQKQN